MGDPVTAVFAVRGAVVKYDGRAVLGPIDLAVPAGQTVSVLGPSGCGKSTLMRLLLGLVAPVEGEVRFEGAPPTRAARLRMGTVIQEGGLFPHLCARDNVALMARQLGWTPSRIAQRLDELVSLTGFPRDGLERFPGGLSGGQRQRVALMRALFLDPEALLLDEPLGALDPIVRADLQTELREIFRAVGKTVVLVTHDLGEAAFLAQRLVLLQEGRVVQDGSLRELVQSPAAPFVTRFVRAQRTLEGLL